MTIHLLETANALDYNALDYYKYFESFLKENPSREISRYDFCGGFSNAYNDIMNIVGGFRCTDIFPFNPLRLFRSIWAIF